MASHGTYGRKPPPGAMVPRWYCRESHTTIRMLADCLSSHLPGTLDGLEAVAEELATELLDRQLHEGDLGFRVRQLRRRHGSPCLGLGRLRLGLRSLGLRLGSLALGRRKRRLQGCNVGPVGHRRDGITAPDSPLQQSSRVSRFAADQPARDSRQVWTGFRQSIPSSRYQVGVHVVAPRHDRDRNPGLVAPGGSLGPAPRSPARRLGLLRPLAPGVMFVEHAVQAPNLLAGQEAGWEKFR